MCDQETSKTRRLKPATGLWKIQPQWVVTPGKQTIRPLRILKRTSKREIEILKVIRAALSRFNFMSSKRTSWIPLRLFKYLDEYNSEHSFKYNQPDAMLYSILYYCQCCTCFGRFLRPSSGAQEMYTSGMCQACLLLPLRWMSWNNSTTLEVAWHIPDAICKIRELLMMVGKTARNIYSIEITKNIV